MRQQKDRIPLEQKSELNLGELLAAEAQQIKQNRRQKGQSDKIKEDALGIALSGGGIRSATVCLGVMQELNEVGLIEKADYMSSVSGGGYLAAYIQMARNKPNPTPYPDLFREEVIEHLRNHKTHLHVAPKNKGWSNFVLLLVGISSFLLGWLWIILPACLFFLSDLPAIYLYPLMLIAAILPAMFLSPNFTSLHRYYKNRLREAYLWQQGNIKLRDLHQNQSPYPLINATVHVNKDDYAKSGSVSYRGDIKTNYFLFSPLYCGSQVTQYGKNEVTAYKNVSLATAMATSGAAFSTFMGNLGSSSIIRWAMILSNLRIGLLAPSPILPKAKRILFPYYTYLEFRGKATTTSYRIQVSDGGHIENLGIYELLRRKVKTIIAIDSGQDGRFNFSDLRNLIIRAKNELGAVIEFENGADPIACIMPNLMTGKSKNHYAIAKISGIKGSYAAGYDGVLVYIKSSILQNKDFRIRALKEEVDDLMKAQSPSFEAKRRALDHIMYSTYNPNFPHQSTADQFFGGEQWDAYYELGKKMGKKVVDDLNLKKEDDRKVIFGKCRR